jgi:hypothetical protein
VSEVKIRSFIDLARHHIPKLFRLYGNEYAEVVATIPSHYGASPDGTIGSIWC